jgi:hypothetical protein
VDQRQFRRDDEVRTFEIVGHGRPVGFRARPATMQQHDCLAGAAGPDSLGALSEQDCLQLHVTPSEHMKREI